jgi:vacuolar protein sorting-associated protein 13A/C
LILKICLRTIGLLRGAFDGVTGVVTQPIEGAKKNGMGGFVTGIGVGLVGLVVKPTAGVIDLVNKVSFFFFSN